MISIWSDDANPSFLVLDYLILCLSNATVSNACLAEEMVVAEHSKPIRLREKKWRLDRKGRALGVNGAWRLERGEKKIGVFVLNTVYSYLPETRTRLLRPWGVEEGSPQSRLVESVPTVI